MFFFTFFTALLTFLQLISSQTLPREISGPIFSETSRGYQQLGMYIRTSIGLVQVKNELLSISEINSVIDRLEACLLNLNKFELSNSNINNRVKCIKSNIKMWAFKKSVLIENERAYANSISMTREWVHTQEEELKLALDSRPSNTRLIILINNYNALEDVVIQKFNYYKKERELRDVLIDFKRNIHNAINNWEETLPKKNQPKHVQNYAMTDLQNKKTGLLEKIKESRKGEVGNVKGQSHSRNLALEREYDNIRLDASLFQATLKKEKKSIWKKIYSLFRKKE